MAEQLLALFADQNGNHIRECSDVSIVVAAINVDRARADRFLRVDWPLATTSAQSAFISKLLAFGGDAQALQLIFGSLHPAAQAILTEGYAARGCPLESTTQLFGLQIA
ncbi:hypothetical protein D9M72_614470 [compost metagenome]